MPWFRRGRLGDQLLPSQRHDPDLLSPQHFAKTKKNQVQQEQWRKELQSKTEGKGEVTPELLSSAMDMQLAETVALVVNR